MSKFNRLPLSIFLLTICSFQLFAQEKTYVDKERRFKFNYYKRWQLDIQENSITVLAPKENKKDIFNENWGVRVSEAKGLSLDEYYNLYITDSFQNTFEDYKKIDEGEMMLNGNKARWIECNYTDVYSRITNLVYLLAKDDKLYIIIAYSSTIAFDELYKEKFINMINTFELM
ncbi:hypothetical protein [Chondrinema litorale]|uniref:hypothetical protein n=1 Tax=Chondrinema litorale TaxID=2994555 RepID=UPI0025436D16|nr:hypothetical protein [Chondrinema litorale]UZR99400.1 hypothetical protein OQ292_36055 [Chondrinema litorale]